MGTRLLEKEARQFGRSLKKIPEADLLKLASDYGLSKLEDLYAAVGFGKYSARQVLTRVLGEPEKGTQTEAEESKPTLVKTVKRMLGFGEAPLIVKGQDDLLVYRAKCCNPIPGDDIIGYITRGRGVAVHTRTCPNVQNLLYQTERRIAVEWGTPGEAKLPRPSGRSREGPCRTAGRHYRGLQQCGLQHPQPRKPSGPLERTN